MTLKEKIYELENNFLYEIQHIPVHHGLDNGEESYFWESELASFIEEGMKHFDDEKQLGYVLLFAANKAIENLVKDIVDKRHRSVIFGFEDSLEHFREVIKDYKEILKDCVILYPKSVLVSM